MQATQRYNNATQQINLCYTYCNFDAYFQRFANAFSVSGSGENVAKVINETNKEIAEKLKILPKSPEIGFSWQAASQFVSRIAGLLYKEIWLKIICITEGLENKSSS